MIEQLWIVSSGGVVLFHKAFSVANRRAVLTSLIQDVLLEGRAGDRELVSGDIKVRWVLRNDTPAFIVVAAYAKFLQLPGVDALLLDVARRFAARARAAASGTAGNPLLLAALGADFGAEFDAAVAAADVAAAAGAAAADAPGGGEEAAAAAAGDEPTKQASSSPSPAAAAAGAGKGASPVKGGDGSLTLANGRQLGARGRPGTNTTGAAAAAAAATTGATSKRRGKPEKLPAPGSSNDNDNGDPAAAAADPEPTEAQLQAQADVLRRAVVRRTDTGAAAPFAVREWESAKRGRLATWLRSYVGSRELDDQDFAGVIPRLREKLIGKNVAVEVAEDVCKSVEASLSGAKLGTFESLESAIEGAMVAALKRILQPKREVNLLRDVAAAKARQRPYSIVFCGVNGVGKSTSLAKIAYWLQQNGHSLVIAAGDTFRHGAVEQLEVHRRCLGVGIVQLGYGTDPSVVAAAAIAKAARDKTDVVMVDTAGRMQDHESRMRALAKLIHDNTPDLVLFVGEALVGNNGVDQLRKFNQCLLDFTPVGTRPRGIDGIVLTKFDTIDDKVGAALTMVYELGQPIVFVGVGQSYQDLKVIEPDVVISALMQ